MARGERKHGATPAGIWVVSDCQHARAGLITVARREADVLSLSGETFRAMLQAGQGGLPERVVVYVGASAVHQMALALALATLLREDRPLPDVLVLGERVEEWLYPALMRLTDQPAVSRCLYCLPATASVRRITQALRSSSGAPRMRTLMKGGWEARVRERLTQREWQALRMSLTGLSVPEQAGVLGVSAKTLYYHRFRALTKLDTGYRRRGQQRLWRAAMLVCSSGPA